MSPIDYSLAMRHLGTIDQSRDDRYVALERGLDLEQDKVFRVIDPSMSVILPGPFRSDDSED
jgi:hypothetical protein